MKFSIIGAGFLVFCAIKIKEKYPRSEVIVLKKKRYFNGSKWKNQMPSRLSLWSEKPLV